MQEQNFEKQVRGKMDELSFVPSAPVWEKVEEQIRKKKDNRHFLFWLLPLLLITSGLGWWLLTSKDTSSVNDTEVVTSQQKTSHQPGGNTLNNNKLNSTIQSSIELNTGEQTKPNKKTESENLIQDSKDKVLVITKDKERLKRDITSKIRNASEDYVITPDQAPIIATITAPREITTLPVFEPSLLTLNRDSIINSKSLNDIIIPHLAETHIPTQKAEKSKWQLAFTAQAGVSGISNGIGIFAKSADMLLFDSSPNLSNAPLTGGGFSNAAPPPTPSVPESGFAFSAGLDVKRKINDRLGVFTGIRYAYYSNSLQVGSTVNRDTSFVRTDASLLRTESYYRNDANLHKYSNRYHFIQIPLALEYKLIKKLPLYVQGGIKLERLLSSNALFYNKYAGVYINDKKMLARTGMHMFTGFNYHFRSNKAFSFAIGPQLQYGTTTLTKKNSSTQQLYFIGLSTQFFIKKGK